MGKGWALFASTVIWILSKNRSVKKPLILCAHGTLNSHEQSVKLRPQREREREREGEGGRGREKEKESMHAKGVFIL